MRIPSNISAYNFTQEVEKEKSFYKIGEVQLDPFFNLNEWERGDTFEAIYSEISTETHEVYSFNPFIRYPGLYRTLAECELDNASIIGFISKYGFLTPTKRLAGIFPEGQPIDTRRRMDGERLKSFKQQVIDMRKAVILLDTFRRSLSGLDRSDISSLLIENDDETWSFFHTPGEPWHDVIRNVNGYTIEQVAVKQLMVLSNKHLSEHAAPRLLLPNAINPFRRAFQRPSLYLNASSLAGVCWIQLAQAVSNSDDLARCADCGTWFSRNVRNGKDKMYCSGACRTRAARRRAQT